MRAIYHDSRESVGFEKNFWEVISILPHNPMFEKMLQYCKIQVGFFRVRLFESWEDRNSKKVKHNCKAKCYSFFHTISGYVS